MSAFSRKLGRKTVTTGLGQILEAAASAVQEVSRIGNASSYAKSALSTESISSSDVQGLNVAVERFEAAIENITNQISNGGINKYTAAQREAGVVAGIMAGDMDAYFSVPTMHAVAATESMSVVGIEGVPNSFAKRSIATEAYDEKENRKVAQYSIAYNIQAARQDEFGEAFFPTITITPDNLGFEVQAKLVSVFNDFKRNISGALDNYQKTSIIRAAIDSTILKSSTTDIIPVNRAESVANFVASGDVAVSNYDLEGESIPTSPLLFNKTFSLLAISQTDALLANGAMDVSDSIDPAINLKSVYLSVGTAGDKNILKFDVINLPGTSFAPAAQGNYRDMNINFSTQVLALTKDTKQANGAALAGTLATIVSSDLTVRLQLSVSGRVNVETGDTYLMAGGLSVVSVRGTDGVALSLSSAPANVFVPTLTAGAGPIGFTLKAYRTNLNRRQRGQLLDTTYYKQLYPVPLRAPITSVKPLTSDGQNDAGELASLISATQIRTSNEAVTALLDACATLGDYIKNYGASGITVAPDILGVSRLLVLAAYQKQDMDMLTVIDSQKAHEKAADIQAVLVNAVRDMAYRLYRDSGYQAAANAMAGGIAAAPTVIIGTDPVLARYLMIDGDLRTLGAELPCRVVATLDNRMTGKIVMSFGQFDNVSENAPNPLHFGNLAWKPEMTMMLPISRGGQTSKELTVQPSYRHVVHLPIAGMINVTNVPNVVNGKINVNMHSV